MQKIALITGTGRGVGKILAEKLLEENYVVHGYSRSNSIVHKRFHFIEVDLSNLNQVQKIQFPIFDSNSTVLFINNAATIGEIVPFFKKSATNIINEYNINLISPTLLSNTFLKTYSHHKKTIINISSGAAIKPISSWSTYCASKASLDMLTRVIDEENHLNLKIALVYPGIINTDMQKKIRSTSEDNFPLKERFVQYYLKKELLSPQIVADKIYEELIEKANFSSIIVKLRDFL